MLVGSRWGVRAGMLALIGGLVAYTYLALGLPGSVEFLQNTGTWGVVIVSLLGAGLGWGATLGWQQIKERRDSLAE